jgi:hypothetical protein
LSLVPCLHPDPLSTCPYAHLHTHYRPEPPLPPMLTPLVNAWNLPFSTVDGHRNVSLNNVLSKQSILRFRHGYRRRNASQSHPYLTVQACRLSSDARTACTLSLFITYAIELPFLPPHPSPSPLSPGCHLLPSQYSFLPFIVAALRHRIPVAYLSTYQSPVNKAPCLITPVRAFCNLHRPSQRSPSSRNVE